MAHEKGRPLLSENYEDMSLGPNGKSGASLPENVLEMSTSTRSWNGVRVKIMSFLCAGQVSHQLPDDSETRLSVLLEEIGDRCEPRLQENVACPIAYMPRHMTLAPAGLTVWGFGANPRFVKDATLSFDISTLSRRLSADFDPALLSTPLLRFADDRVWSLVKLLSDVVDDPDPSSQLYGDGLVAAIAARLFCSPTKSMPDEAKGLSPRLLRNVIEYLHLHLPDRVELADLAEVAGLSQSHFSRAFKASTGFSPYRWQLEHRVRRAQALLLDTPASLEEVAEATGFADAVHFGRTFRKHIGVTPAAWRQDRKR